MIGSALKLHLWFAKHVVAASAITTIVLLLWALLFRWWGNKIDAIKDWPPFKQLLKAKQWLILAIIAGIAGNAAWAILGSAATSEKETAEPPHSQHDSGPHGTPDQR